MSDKKVPNGGNEDCPFCGADGNKNMCVRRYAIKGAYAQCGKCGAQTGVVYDDPSGEKCIKKWNTRSYEPIGVIDDSI